jgi:hypothetical protein
VKKRNRFCCFFLLLSILLASPAFSQEDESILFTTLSPDVLLLLDLSGSMLWAPAGQVMYISSSYNCDTETNIPFYTDNGTGHAKACTIDAYGSVPKYSNTSCSGPFYRSSTTGYTTNCSRLAIAKRGIFDILDDNDSNSITKQDEKSLNIRFGYMRFTACSSDDIGGSYSSGCNKLIKPIGSLYSSIYCNSSTSCSSISSSTGSVSGESASDGTPLSSALHEAKLYLDAHKAADQAKACRAKFVLLITDGADTFACGGGGTEDQSDQYKRRRAVVLKTKALADAGYKVFVVGFGAGMPHFLRNTLNWMAYYGQTDNPLAANSGAETGFDPTANSLCSSSTTATHNIEGDGTHTYALSNDPGESTLAGYAFLASSAADLTTALKQAVNAIRESNYSFSMVSITSFRTQDENYLYEASFQPQSSDPFWRGHLKKYVLDINGNVGDPLWDAGTLLSSVPAGNRTMYTLLSGSLTAFQTAQISKEILGVATDAERDLIVGYLRGESAYNPDGWKLGDIYHSNPVTVATPSKYFNDLRDANGAFISFRGSHPRTSANGQRIVLASANDGQMHAFRSSDGAEVWSLIPPNLLPKLKNLAHATHPVGYSHQYFVDGPITVADAWLATGDGKAKAASDWRTLLIFGEGRGANPSLWSASSSCSSDFNATYSADYPHYCGYYAFDLTNTASPISRWRLQPAAGQEPYWGDPWSKMTVGRVRINGNERWVGFMGAGYNATDCSDSGDCDQRGKGFFVVDLIDGTILWGFTRAQDNAMNFSMVGSPAIVDTDFDGFIDKVYLGDLGGNVWRFKFCRDADPSTCGISDWSGGQMFAASASGDRPIYTTVAVTQDQYANLWVSWGTGDKTDPLALPVVGNLFQDKLFAVKDNDRTSTYVLGNLEDISSTVYQDAPAKKGWYVTLAGSGEKILADPAFFGGVVYFTTFTPDQTGNPCTLAGTGKLYGIALMLVKADQYIYQAGGGVITPPPIPGVPGSGNRSMVVGYGIPTAPVISFKPSGALPPDIYVTTSGGAGMDAVTARVNFNPPAFSSRTNILSWKDRRVQ